MEQLERGGTSDRMVVYYFSTKSDLVSAVVLDGLLRLRQQCGPAAANAARRLGVA